MSLYIHIPFCSQACSYCDFHFSTNKARLDELVDCLVCEMELRWHYLSTDGSKPKLDTIYFGGGTPSLLTTVHLEKLFASIDRYFEVSKDSEITLEANPDDLTEQKLEQLSQSPINRLSIGIQSFFDDDLAVLRRTHNSNQAIRAVESALKSGFNNLTIDLMYGLPGMTIKRWEENLIKAMSLPVQHLSCYCLTIETGTLLNKQVKDGKVMIPGDDATALQFELLMDIAEQHAFDHYEISNFARSGYYSRHNSSYWIHKPYLGIGPSAHSYNGKSRQWNISSNAAYISALGKKEIPATVESLTMHNRYNEYLMTGLRTSRGVHLDEIRENFGAELSETLSNDFSNHLASGNVQLSNRVYILTRKGKLLADRIASSLFLT